MFPWRRSALIPVFMISRKMTLVSYHDAQYIWYSRVFLLQTDYALYSFILGKLILLSYFFFSMRLLPIDNARNLMSISRASIASFHSHRSETKRTVTWGQRKIMTWCFLCRRVCLCWVLHILHTHTAWKFEILLVDTIHHEGKLVETKGVRTKCVARE